MNGMRKWWRAAVFALAGGVLAACGGGEDPATGRAATPTAAVAEGHRDAQGYALSTVIWQQLEIPVCWTNPSASDATEREWVRLAVQRTWERSSQVRFTGWNACPANNPHDAVRIRIADTTAAPATYSLGNRIPALDTGVILNFTFANWSQECTQHDATFRRHCIEAIAAHEFGHVLGFAHEQGRPDTPTEVCERNPAGIPGDTLVGAWDPQSILNYCNPRFNNDGMLSETDVAMVQRYYRAPLRDADFTFDADFYLSYYPDLRAAFGNDQQAARDHWVNWGRREGRRASLEFDAGYYLAIHPDLRAAYGNDHVAALTHWANFGINEGRRGSREVDVRYYINTYADARQWGGENYRYAMSHWVGNGFALQRQASAEFGIANYFARYPDLREAYRYTSSFTAYTNDANLGFMHWLKWGKDEQRTGS